MLHGFWLYNTALHLQDVGRCCAFRGDRGWVQRIESSVLKEIAFSYMAKDLEELKELGNR